MHRSLIAVGLVACLAGCVRRSSPAPVAPPDTPERVQCDRLAARAIQAPSAADARTLAEQAAACYATIRVANGDGAMEWLRMASPFALADPHHEEVSVR